MEWHTVLAAYYVGAGLFIMAFTLARLQVAYAVRELTGRKARLGVRIIVGGVFWGASIVLWPLFLKGWFARVGRMRDIFPGGDAYRWQRHRLRMMDAVRREIGDNEKRPVRLDKRGKSSGGKKVKVWFYDCPFCGGKRAVAIVYGYPAPETLQMWKDKKIELGGCIVDGMMPSRACPECHKEWSAKKCEGNAYEEEYVMPELPPEDEEIPF